MQSVSPFEVNVPHFKLGDFSNLSSIASGGEGEVNRGTHDNLGNVAVKTLFRPVRIDELKELKILVEVKHPHIVQLFGILVSDRDLTKCSGYVMELMKFGSLNSVIHNPSIYYDMRQVYSWMEQAGRGLKYLHDRNIIHRDIKPNNMLLVSMDHLKIADFGLAREIVIDESITGGIGTCFYMAPEIIESHRYGPTADIYAFIVSIWEIVYRKMPYYDLEHKSMVTFLKEVTENRRRPIIEEGFKVDAEMRELIQKGWDADPAKRVTIDEIINYAKQKMIQEDGKTILLFSREKSNMIQILNHDKSQWKTISLDIPESHDCGAACLNDEIYIFGGWSLEKKMYKMNKKMEWIQMANMNESRQMINNSSLVFEGCIWVLGGRNQHTVEKYVPEENNWIQMPSMREKREHAAAAACRDKIFVSGGINEGGILNSVECFDPQAKIWTIFTNLLSPLRAHAMISDWGSLIILGGFDGKIRSNSIWKINPDEKVETLKALPSMKAARSDFSAAALGKEIFAIGSYEEKTVEVFNGQDWRKGPDFPFGCYGMPMVVISSNLAENLCSMDKIEKEEEPSHGTIVTDSGTRLA